MSKYSREIDLEDANSAATKIIGLVGRNKKVLEFGCAGGHMSRVLKERFGCRVVGIEIDPRDAEDALSHCEEVIVGDIEDMEWCRLLSGRKFDVAVFADVLEHLKRPEKALQRVGEFLDRDGYILLSVPNIANVSVRLELLSGGFEYESLGILDDTHLKYFTRKSIVKLVEGAGLFIESLDYSVRDLPDRIIADQLNSMGLRPTRRTMDSFSTVEAVAFEFILKARPRKPKGYVPYIFMETKKPQRIMEEVLREQVKRIREKDKHIANLEADLADGKKHIKNVEARLEDQKRHIETLEAERRDRRRHIANIEKELKDRKAHARNVEERLKDREKHIETLESERADRRRHIANIEKELEDRKAHARNVEELLKDRKKHICNLEILQKDRNRHISNLEEMARQGEARLLRMESELKDRTARLEQLEKELRHERSRSQQLKRASLRSEQEAKDLKVQLGRKEDLIAALQQAANRRREEIKGLEDRIVGFEETVKNLNSNISSLKASLSWRVTRPFRSVFDLCGRLWKSVIPF